MGDSYLTTWAVFPGHERKRDLPNRVTPFIRQEPHNQEKQYPENEQQAKERLYRPRGTGTFWAGRHRISIKHRRPPHGECAGRHRRVVGYVSAIGASLTRALWSGALRCTSTEASRSMKLRLRDGEVNTTKVLCLLYSDTCLQLNSRFG